MDFTHYQRAGIKLALEQMSLGGYTPEEAKRLFAGEDVDPKEVTEGLNAELEHRGLTEGKDAPTKEIVEDHLREDPHYYTKLHKAGL